MSNEDEMNKKEYVEDLVQAAVRAEDADLAMKFAQAALNAAHALHVAEQV